jgi:hypothetical protein
MDSGRRWLLDGAIALAGFTMAESFEAEKS